MCAILKKSFLIISLITLMKCFICIKLLLVTSVGETDGTVKFTGRIFFWLTLQPSSVVLRRIDVSSVILDDLCDPGLGAK